MPNHQKHVSQAPKPGVAGFDDVTHAQTLNLTGPEQAGEREQKTESGVHCTVLYLIDD